MPTFKYKSTSRDGKVSEGALTAGTREEAVRMIQASGQIPLRVEAKGFGRGLSFKMEVKLPGLGSRISPKDVLLFTQEFRTLVGAGLPLDKCLVILAEVAEKEALAGVIRDVLDKVQGGKSLADAMEEQSGVFSSLYVNMIRAGEAGGVLQAVLERIEEYAGRIQELKETMVSALIYPSMLVVVGAFSLVILMAFVLPKFQAIFDSMGRSLPLSTQVLMGVSTIVRHYWWALIGVLAACVAGVRYYLRTEAGGTAWDRTKLRLPVIGPLVQKMETSRFARTLGTLLNSGIPFLQALHIVRDVLQNRVMSQALGEVASGVRGGKGIAGTLAKSKLFPPLALHLIQVGEETGTLDHMLHQVADNYDRYLQNAIKRVIALMEPVMILVVAILIGFVVVSMLNAIFSINELPM